MPQPPAELHYVGDGDYRAIGAEFLEHLVRRADLVPSDRVLDIGCGIGRLAFPLTQFLDQGSYDGIDPVAAGIEWCTATVTPVYPNFRFHHLDLRHPLYNPAGSVDTRSVRLPFEDGKLRRRLHGFGPHPSRAGRHPALRVGNVTAAHARRPVLRYGVPDESARARRPARGQRRISFDGNEAGPVYFGIKDAPLAAVAYDEDVLLELFLRHGLRRRNPAAYGTWSGRGGAGFQDICVFDKEL